MRLGLMAPFVSTFLFRSLPDITRISKRTRGLFHVHTGRQNRALSEYNPPGPLPPPLFGQLRGSIPGASKGQKSREPRNRNPEENPRYKFEEPGALEAGPLRRSWAASRGPGLGLCFGDSQRELWGFRMPNWPYHDNDTQCWSNSGVG